MVSKNKRIALGNIYIDIMAKIFHWIFIYTGSHQPISITENTSIDEFLSNAEAAQRSFEAERGTAAIAVSKNGLYSMFYENTEKISIY